MKRVKFQAVGNPLQFPDDISLFTNIEGTQDGFIIADYKGSMPLDEYVEDKKQLKLKDLNAWHDAQTEAMKAKYSKAEVDSFLDKRNEALAYRKDNTVQTPYIMAMAGGNEATRIMLINSILAKVDAVAQLEAYVLAKRDEIEACTTQEELEATTW